MNDLQEIRKIHESMKMLKRWLQSQFKHIDWVLRLKKDINFYMHEQAQLEIRVAKLEAQALQDLKEKAFDEVDQSIRYNDSAINNIVRASKDVAKKKGDMWE